MNNTTNVSNSSLTTEEDINTFEYLASALGPQRQPLAKLVPITVLYIGTFSR